MNRKKIKYLSYLFSIGIHLGIMGIFAFITLSSDFPEDDFLTVGFGTFGKVSSAKVIKPKKKEKEKDVQVPKTKNSDETNNVKPVVEKAKVKKEEKEKEENENEGLNEGNYGFSIDFGGKGQRTIYSYSLPSYPAGVDKEIDIKLRFSILPDGTVGDVFPIRKGDTRLEMAAIRSLKQWRFEPIQTGKKVRGQVAVITFPYRLN